MNRLNAPVGPASAVGSPDMTVLEAADAMERSHGSRLLVQRDNRVIGVLTERDIVEKVLNAGRRPDLVTVDAIMSAGWEKGDGSILLEDTLLDNDWEDTSFAHILQGKCEECGVFNLDLSDEDGLLVCADCRGGTAS